MEVRREQLHDLEQELLRLSRVLHDLGEREHDLARSIDRLERQAITEGLREVSSALRNAYMRLIDAGLMLTQAHLDLSVPPTVFLPDDH